ncbi:DUF3887 domain-containing protein [Metasolibacillus meyeri]|uniref:DUF3887 domain-containing protein n=1 Tax=Metasolibacillus meyeri TaxID=1071052 RepID=A0AAW9NR33_9BACL|nr:DUF3887 domain-containing protein [Metasolibacillus meyeri]MEC1177789.1 DUF3887 domain-containing protein [Metasolibacillus meyeri]
MKRFYITLISSLCLAVLLAGCGNKVEEEIAQQYESKAEEIIQFVNKGEFEEITQQFDAKMKASVTAEQLAEITPVIEASGNFVQIKKISIQEKDGVFIVVLVAEYSKDERIYTISYNDKEEIAGLYIQ